MALNEQMPDSESPRDPVELAFRRFACFAKDGSSHPRVWVRLYQFIAVAHARNKGWSHTEIRQRLIGCGVPEAKATEYSEIYWHGRCILYVRSHPQQRITNYIGWLRSGASRLT